MTLYRNLRSALPDFMANFLMTFPLFQTKEDVRWAKWLAASNDTAKKLFENKMKSKTYEENDILGVLGELSEFIHEWLDANESCYCSPFNLRKGTRSSDVFQRSHVSVGVRVVSSSSSLILTPGKQNDHLGRARNLRIIVSLVALFQSSCFVLLSIFAPLKG